MTSLLDAFLGEDGAVLASKRELHLAIRRDGIPDPVDPNAAPTIIGDGSPENPLDASLASKKSGLTSVQLRPSYER